ncbi:MAG: hypothetical protein P4L73_08315 [Caulobacteraceae bacterium]|nr:hypothetical protein [Caulobacteraceae bacterium]
MTQRMQDLASQIVALQAELDREIETRRKVLGWTVRRRMVEFEHGVTEEHRRLRTSVAGFLGRASLGAVLTAPVIYSMILPFLLLDGWVSLYQAICFRAYRIPRVRRGDYVVFDRRKLAYLNWIEALNCVYCGYANGVTAYAREIGSRTEQYWCPIKHALRISDPHQRYVEFLEYGDAEGYRARLDAFRNQLRDEPAGPQPAPGA